MLRKLKYWIKKGYALARLAWKILMVEHRLPWIVLSRYYEVERWYGFPLLKTQQTIAVRFSSIFLRKRIRKICIWRPWGIGDTIMLHPIAKSLKKEFSRARITFICSNDKTKIEVAKRIPSFDDICINPEGCSTVANFKKVSKREFDLILSPFYENVYCMVFGNKFGIDKPLIASLYSSIGLKPENNIKLEYNLTEEEKQFASEYKNRLGDYIVLVDKSGPFTTKRNWFNDYWQRLIDLQTLPVIIIGTSKNIFERCIDLRNKISIHQCAALIKECRLFIGVIAGPFWFTNVFEKEAVILNGGFEPPIFTQHPKSRHLFSDIDCAPCLDPLGECPFGMVCMKMIKPEIVNEKIKSVLNNKT